MKNLKHRAAVYFNSIGVNPAVPPAEVTTLPCVIEVECFMFYTYVEVSVPDKGMKFCGSSGGIGVPGDLTAAGVIYFADWDKLKETDTFGVAFLAEDGGVVQVTWGSRGNASAAGVGEGGGAFGGSGSWKSL